MRRCAIGLRPTFDPQASETVETISRDQPVNGHWRTDPRYRRPRSEYQEVSPVTEQEVRRQLLGERLERLSPPPTTSCATQTTSWSCPSPASAFGARTTCRRFGRPTRSRRPSSRVGWSAPATSGWSRRSGLTPAGGASSSGSSSSATARSGGTPAGSAVRWRRQPCGRSGWSAPRLAGTRRHVCLSGLTEVLHVSSGSPTLSRLARRRSSGSGRGSGRRR